MANMHLITGYAGEAHVTAADQGSLHAALFGEESYVLNRGSKLAATVVSNNSITIADGDIMMQGRHARIEEDTPVSLAIENGTQGNYRNDLIVARYTKNASTGAEAVNLVVIKGTPAASGQEDPAYTEGDIIHDHAAQADMPLYRVKLNGLTIEAVESLFAMAGQQRKIVVGSTDPDGVTGLAVGDIYIYLES